jgi:putative NADH-flavin reductase
MRVVVFGATGRTGRHLVEGALGRGREVTAFVRDPSKLAAEHERLRVVEGDVMDAAAVERAVVGQDAVLVALGHGKGRPKDVLAGGARNIVDAMKRHGVRRIVNLTGAGVRDAEDEPGIFDRVMVALLKRLQRDLLRDSERQAEIIKGSSLDWVIVRGTVLTDGPRKGEYRVGPVGKNSGTRISRADIVDFMLDRLEGDAYLGRMPVVSY